VLYIAVFLVEKKYSLSKQPIPTLTLTSHLGRYGITRASIHFGLQFNLLFDSPSSPSSTTMATTNVGGFLEERYVAAIAKYNTDRHADALDELSDLLMDDHLPLVLRLKANCALADGVRDWFLAESYYTAAEMIHDVIRTSLHFLPGSQEETELAHLRKMLDSLAEDQRRMDPRQIQKPDNSQHSNARHDALTTLSDAEPTVKLTDQSTTILQGPQAPEQPIMGSPPRSLSKFAAMACDGIPSEEDYDTPARLPSHPGPTITQSGND
jgi:hypothetical protein